MKTVPVELLRQRFHCDASQGVLTWKVRGKGIANGARAGHKTPRGYRVVGIDGRQYAEHCVIFAMHYGKWPAKFIDHINGVPDDNRIENLREATKSQNNWNMRLHTRNKTGLKGVHLTQKGRYRAQIMTPTGRKYLGQFDTAEEGHAAYVRAAVKHFGEFARAA